MNNNRAGILFSFGVVITVCGYVAHYKPLYIIGIVIIMAGIRLFCD